MEAENYVEWRRFSGELVDVGQSLSLPEPSFQPLLISQGRGNLYAPSPLSQLPHNTGGEGSLGGQQRAVSEEENDSRRKRQNAMRVVGYGEQMGLGGSRGGDFQSPEVQVDAPFSEDSSRGDYFCPHSEVSPSAEEDYTIPLVSLLFLFF